MALRFFFSCLCFFLVLISQNGHANSYPLGVVDDDVLAVAYQGEEKLSYSVSWTGGIKIGELHMEVNRLEGEEERFELRVRVTDSWIFHFFYPVDDTFVTVVAGYNRLPVTYEVEQNEGSYQARRYTQYFQKTGEIYYTKNDREPVKFQVSGDVHNEFSSFFFTRVLDLVTDKPVLVPTFADGERHEVVVKTGESIPITGTLLGDVDTLPVSPVMTFKGLYDKEGDTVIWFTDDLCRVPVRINSKIFIGSLTAELVSYSNPLCSEHK